MILAKEARDTVSVDGQYVAVYIFNHRILEDDDGNLYELLPIVGLGIEIE